MMKHVKIYLAARFSRRDELQGYAAQLTRMGHEVTSRWLWVDHQLTDADQQDREVAYLRGHVFALDDLADVRRADIVVSFTESPRTGTRGGRHVEFGIGLERELGLVIIGPREHVFHYLPWVIQYDSWEAYYNYLLSWDER
jgi:hypothetical protein